MPKVTAAAIAATALLLVALTGCADTGTSAGGGGESQRTSTEQSETPTPSDSPKPLVAETPGPGGDGEVDAKFTDYVRGELLPDTGIANASDEQLIAAGREACELLLDGVDSLDIRLIEGEQPASSGYYMDSAAIIDGARRYYCPETIH